MLIKRTINQETLTILNMYIPNSGPPNFIKHTSGLKDTE